MDTLYQTFHIKPQPENDFTTEFTRVVKLIRSSHLIEQPHKPFHEWDFFDTLTQYQPCILSQTIPHSLHESPLYLLQVPHISQKTTGYPFTKQNLSIFTHHYRNVYKNFHHLGLGKSDDVMEKKLPGLYILETPRHAFFIEFGLGPVPHLGVEVKSTVITFAKKCGPGTMAELRIEFYMGSVQKLRKACGNEISLRKRLETRLACLADPVFNAWFVSLHNFLGEIEDPLFFELDENWTNEKVTNVIREGGFTKLYREFGPGQMEKNEEGVLLAKAFQIFRQGYRRGFNQWPFLVGIDSLFQFE